MSSKRSRSGTASNQSPSAKCPFEVDDGNDVIDVDASTADHFVRYTSRNGSKLLVCKQCYATFAAREDEAVFVKVGRGFKGVLSENATAQSIQQHLNSNHRPKASTGCVAQGTMRQTTLDHWFHADSADDVALLWTVLGASYRLVEHPHVKKMMGQMFRGANCDTREKMRRQIAATSTKLKASILETMKGKTGFLAIDAGTLLRKCFLNVCVAVERRVFFWKSFLGRRMTSDFIKKVIEEVVSELAQNETFVVGVVSDSASNMVAACRALKYDECESTSQPDSECGDAEEVEVDDCDGDDEADATAEDNLVADETVAEAIEGIHRFINHQRCWAHCFQLLPGDAAKKSKIIRDALDAVARLAPLLQSRCVSERLHDVARQRNIEVRAIHTPCVTRWNSYIKSMVTIS